MCDHNEYKPNARITDPMHPQYNAPDINKRIDLDPKKPSGCGIPDHLGFRERRIDDPDVIAENNRKLLKG